MKVVPLLAGLIRRQERRQRLQEGRGVQQLKELAAKSFRSSSGLSQHSSSSEASPSTTAISSSRS